MKIKIISQFRFHCQADPLGVHKNSAFRKPVLFLPLVFRHGISSRVFFVAKDQDMNMHKEASNCLGSSTALKKPVVIMDHKLNLSQRNKDNISQKYLIRLLYVGHPWQLSCSTQCWWNLSWNIESIFRYHIKTIKPHINQLERAQREQQECWEAEKI